MSGRLKNRPELWGFINGYEKYYQISSFGKVKRVSHHREDGKFYREKILKPGRADTGYLTVALWKDKKQKTFYIHRLVAQSFIKKISDKKVVNHKDKNRQNNKLENLEWVTPKENAEHGNGKCVCQYTLQGEYVCKFNTVALASVELGIDASGIAKVARKKRSKAGGFKWSYV